MQVSIDFTRFTPWGQAVDTWEKIRREDKLEDFERVLEDLYEEGNMTETALNDLLAYEWEWVYEILGIEED